MNTQENTSVKPQDAHDQSILQMENIDPVESICDLLTTYGHPNPRGWLVNIEADATNPNVEPDIRRFLVNRQWRQILGVVQEEDTTRARYCLVDRGPLNVWLVLFKQSVMPVAIRYQLPNSSF
jgi:hypothetical protein